MGADCTDNCPDAAGGKDAVVAAPAKCAGLKATSQTRYSPRQAFDVWHDRAVFHFLVTEEERCAYVDKVLFAVKPSGHVIVATFAEDGPLHCSGLPVMRYGAKELHAEFGSPAALVQHEKEEHHTPFGTIQKLVDCYCPKLLPE